MADNKLFIGVECCGETHNNRSHRPQMYSSEFSIPTVTRGSHLRSLGYMVHGPGVALWEGDGCKHFWRPQKSTKTGPTCTENASTECSIDLYANPWNSNWKRLLQVAWLSNRCIGTDLIDPGELDRRFMSFFSSALMVGMARQHWMASQASSALYFGEIQQPLAVPSASSALVSRKFQ